MQSVYSPILMALRAAVLIAIGVAIGGPFVFIFIAVAALLLAATYRFSDRRAAP